METGENRRAGTKAQVQIFVWIRWICGVVSAIGASIWLGNRSHPPISEPVELRLLLPNGIAGRSSPLLVTGQTLAGTILYVRYTAPDRVIFGYDSWGVGGPESPEVRIVPDKTFDLRIFHPAISAPREVDRRVRGTLRVDYGGLTVLHTLVHYHGRRPEEIYVGENPIGGTSTNDLFRGVISDRKGGRIQGRPTALNTVPERLEHLFLKEFPAVMAALAFCLLTIWLVPAAAKALKKRWVSRELPQIKLRDESPHAVFVATSSACILLFSAVVSGGSFDLTAKESFGEFYDYQAASLLKGRIDVPREALYDEAFIFRGKAYGYFGPTPALLRLPFVALDVGFGRLSRLFMVGYFGACLWAAYALLVHAFRTLGEARAKPGRSHVVLLILASGAGSTLLFLGSRAYTYHEAILCGSACALWSTWFSLRWIESDGEKGTWIPALLLGVLSVHARPPTGLFALATLGSAAAVVIVKKLGSSHPCDLKRITRPSLIGMLAVLGVISFNLLSYAKFRSLEGAPLKYHVQYSDPGNPWFRSTRLANISGSNFHLNNVPYGIAGYFVNLNLTYYPSFPYLYIRGTDPAKHPGSRIDLAENTLGIPWAMPTLTLLAMLGFGVMWLRWPEATVALAVLAGGLAPMAAALLAAVAQSHRYTADFVPFLIAAAAFGLAGTDALTVTARRWWLGLAALLTPAAIAVTLAITVHYQGEGVWGVSDEIKARYLAMRRWSDHALGFKP